MKVIGWHHKNLRHPIINLSADLEVSKLEKLINEHVDSILYQDTSFTDNNNDNLKVKAWKAGDVKLRFEQDELSWELPARVIFPKGGETIWI